MPGTIILSLHLDPVLAQYLGSTSCESFLHCQPDRFEVLAIDGISKEVIDNVPPVLLGRDFEGGTMTWCAAFSDALLLRAYEQACGFETAILWDLASVTLLPSGGCPDGYVLLSSRRLPTD